MNPWCGNRGDVLKHLVLCELLVHLGGSDVTYVDPLAGRPFNHLMDAEYEFSRRGTAKAGWADQFLTAVEAGPCQALAETPYVGLLTESHPEGTFWQEGSIGADPVYPGSAGFAWLLWGSAARWVCGDSSITDRAELRLLLGRDAVRDEQVGAPGGWDKMVGVGAPATLVLVDPFDLTARGSLAEAARGLVYAAAYRGATVAAWYPRGPRFDPQAIAGLTIRLRTLTAKVSIIESSWDKLGGSGLTGAGMLLVGLDRQKATEIGSLVQQVDKLRF